MLNPEPMLPVKVLNRVRPKIKAMRLLKERQKLTTNSAFLLKMERTASEGTGNCPVQSKIKLEHISIPARQVLRHLLPVSVPQPRKQTNYLDQKISLLSNQIMQKELHLNVRPSLPDQVEERDGSGGLEVDPGHGIDGAVGHHHLRQEDITEMAEQDPEVRFQDDMLIQEARKIGVGEEIGGVLEATGPQVQQDEEKTTKLLSRKCISI